MKEYIDDRIREESEQQNRIKKQQQDEKGFQQNNPCRRWSGGQRRRSNFILSLQANLSSAKNTLFMLNHMICLFSPLSSSLSFPRVGCKSCPLHPFFLLSFLTDCMTKSTQRRTIRTKKGRNTFGTCEAIQDVRRGGNMMKQGQRYDLRESF